MFACEPPYCGRNAARVSLLLSDLPRGAHLVDDGDRRAGGDGLAFFADDLAQHAADRRGHFGVDLVGRDLDERFVLFDRSPGFLSHCATVPSVTVSPSCGIVIVVAML
jgi:hypothetical protein